MKGSPTCTFGRFCVGLFGEFGGSQQRSAVNTVATGLRAHVDDRVAGSARLRKKQIFFVWQVREPAHAPADLRIARLKANCAAEVGTPKQCP